MTAATAEVVRFRALGTYVHVATEQPADLATAGVATRDVLAAVDRTCSRFREDSDLARANRAAGRWVAVDPILVGAVEAALRAAYDTDGLVNPLLGKVIVDLGYSRDFAELTPPITGTARSRHPRVTDHDADAWRRIEVEPGAVRLPAGTALDLGSIGKAWAGDLVVGTLATRLDAGALVSVGGDIAMLGDAEWPVAVQEPGQDDHLVWVRGGGLATSSTEVRRWTHEGVVRHHLLDPAHRAAGDGDVANGHCDRADLRGGERGHHRRRRARP